MGNEGGTFSFSLHTIAYIRNGFKRFVHFFLGPYFHNNETLGNLKYLEKQVRFSVTLETMVVEKELTADNRNHFMSLAKDRASPPRGASRERSDHNGMGRGSGVAR